MMANIGISIVIAKVEPPDFSDNYVFLAVIAQVKGSTLAITRFFPYFVSRDVMMVEALFLNRGTVPCQNNCRGGVVA